MLKKIFFLVIIVNLININAFSQVNQAGQDVSLNPLTTGVPFLIIAPDARAGALGDAGVATSPDPNSIHWNPAKYAFIDQKITANISYIPWLRNLVSDINFANLSGSYKVNNNHAVALSLMYFSLGNISFTEVTGDAIRDFNPNEFSISAAYALKFTENLSGGVALRYVHSNLTGGIAPQGQSPTKPGNAFAGDISVYYNKKFGASALGLGANFSNLGTKISYGDDSFSEFIPANMRLGASYTYNINERHSIMGALDFNKLLVPTPPEYDPVNTDSIIAGKNPNVSSFKGIFQSFGDAPGGFSEEIKEIMYSFGVEYYYNKMFAIRAGYFHERQAKGNRKYITAGVGIKLNVFSLDFAYLIPTTGSESPYSNTLKFTLGFNLKGSNNVSDKEGKTKDN